MLQHDFEMLKVSLAKTGILTVVLSRPKALNALNDKLLDEFYTVLKNAKNNPEVKALLITGDGEKAFCAGADINRLADLDPQEGIAFSQQGQQVFLALEELGKPSLAAINGYTFGGGCELAMAATLRIASNKAVFGQPEVKLGVLPCYGGTQRLARLVGKGRAMDLCITARSISAQDALSWGLVTEVMTPEELIPRAEAILHTILSMAPLAVKGVMDAINTGYDLTYKEAEKIETLLFATVCATEDKKIGVTAFLNKTTPAFVGK